MSGTWQGRPVAGLWQSFVDAKLTRLLSEDDYVDATDEEIVAIVVSDSPPRSGGLTSTGALPGYARGMAWTTSQKRAARFADRWAQATGR